MRRKFDERDEELRRQTITVAQLIARVPPLSAHPTASAAEATSTNGQAETQHGAAPEKWPARRRWWQRLVWG